MTVIYSPFLFFLLQNYNAKISNFGLAILGPSGADSHVTTGVVGTYGYAAPEYIATGNGIFIKFYIWIMKSCDLLTLMKSL